MLGIAYHKDYNKYDLGVNHPLVGDKPAKTMDFLKEKNILSEIKVFSPTVATDEDILRVHSKQYLDRLKTLSKTGGKLSADTPAPKGIYKNALLPVGGTLLCGTKLFSGFYCMVNPLGGFHHAGRDSSSGFCFFNDIAIVIEYLRVKKSLQRFMIVDCDVHHGNGTQELFYSDPSVLNVSFHQDGKTLYPHSGFIDEIGAEAGKGFTVNLPFPPGAGTATYLRAFKSIVPHLIEEFNPEIIIYQGGVDTHYSDPLADLELSYPAYYFMAKKMMELSKKSCNKLLVLLGGGYNGNTSVISYYNIMCGLLDKNEYIKEKSEGSFQKFSELNIRVNKLKELLKPYWSF